MTDHDRRELAHAAKQGRLWLEMLRIRGVETMPGTKEAQAMDPSQGSPNGDRPAPQAPPASMLDAARQAPAPAAEIFSLPARLDDLAVEGGDGVWRPPAPHRPGALVMAVPHPLNGPYQDRPGQRELDLLAAQSATCERCGLAATRTQVVFGHGNPQTTMLIVGEAPGEQEDHQGIPFVGAAGQALSSLLHQAGIDRRKVYIANILKCRPPGNRNPTAEETAACTPWLLRQIDLVKPKVIVALGKPAANYLLDTDAAIGALRGRVFQGDATARCRGVPLVATYHPSYYIRQGGDQAESARPTRERIIGDLRLAAAQTR